LKRKIVIGPRAKAETRGIWHRTAAEHGTDAADAYVRDLDQAMELVRDFPHIGSNCSDVRKGYRRIRSGSHLIYYIVRKEDIYVMRILHERQDARTNLR
jgi:toxin ParE1/3/4